MINEDVHQIVDNIFLGSKSAAMNINWLKMNKITHVLDIGSSFPIQYYENVYNTLKIQRTYMFISDQTDVSIKSVFSLCHNIIDSCINSDGNILIHCEMGISRSATIVISYLMYKKQMTMDEAIAFIKSKRSIIKPNCGFLYQLSRYETELNNEKYEDILTHIENNNLDK